MPKGEVQTRAKATEPLATLSQLTLDNLVIGGDLSRLTPQQKIEYYCYRAHQCGLDPAAKPFDLLTLNGKQILYANAACAQQLCDKRNLSVRLVGTEKADDIIIVTAEVTGPDGRATQNVGSVPLGGLKGEALSNAHMKCRTKAIRRTVLAHCGLGMLDEDEVKTIPGAKTEVIEVPAVIHPTKPSSPAPTPIVEIEAEPMSPLTYDDPEAEEASGFRFPEGFVLPKIIETHPGGINQREAELAGAVFEMMAQFAFRAGYSTKQVVRWVGNHHATLGASPFAEWLTNAQAAMEKMAEAAHKAEGGE